MEPGASVPPDACGLDLESLPSGAGAMGFLELAMALAADPRGYALLTGLDAGAAGLDLFRVADRYGSKPDSSGNAFSFCVNGSTYTAFEYPDDGYRSALSHMVERPGNWCQTRFGPCALLPRFKTSVYDAEGLDWSPSMKPSEEGSRSTDMLELLLPGSSEVALAVGTDASDDYYPCFVAFSDPGVLTRARALGIALAYELDAQGALCKPGAVERARKGRLWWALRSARCRERERGATAGSKAIRGLFTGMVGRGCGARIGPAWGLRWGCVGGGWPAAPSRWTGKPWTTTSTTFERIVKEAGCITTAC